MDKIRNLEQVFARLGLKKHAALVYKTISENGPILAAQIAKSCRLHRPEVYRMLHPLLHLELIAARHIGKRTYYVAESTNRIRELYITGLEDVIDVARKMSRKQENAETVGSLRIFRGPDGIRAVFDDVINSLKRGETFFRYTSEKNLEAVNRFLSPDYRKRRDNKNLERLVISNPVSGSQKRPRLERFIKFIPPEFSLFDQNIIQIIYKDRVALIDLNTEQAFVIENAPLADFQKVIFKQLYRKL